MAFIEFTKRDGARFMMDFHSHWEVIDCGAGVPARWSNHEQGRNLDCGETYEALRGRLLGGPSSEPSILEEAKNAIEGLLSNIRRNAPQLSGKSMGYAEDVLRKIAAHNP